MKFLRQDNISVDSDITEQLPNNNNMWNQKAAQVIPIVISSTGVIPKSLLQSLTRLNLHPNTHIQLQISVIPGTCSIVRNFLNYK